MDSFPNREPVKLVEERRSTLSFGDTKDKTSGVVLNFLESIELVLRETGEKRITIVKPGQDKSTYKGVSSFSGQMLTNAADATEVEVSRFANGRNLLIKREIIVEIDSKIASERRDRYFRAIQRDGMRERVTF